MKAKPAADKITPDMKIGDLMHKYPTAAWIMVEEGIGCFGCGAAQFETIEEGLKAHGKDEKEIKEILKKMNDLLRD